MITSSYLVGDQKWPTTYKIVEIFIIIVYIIHLYLFNLMSNII